MDETYLVFRSGPVFQSKLAFGKRKAFEAAVQFIFGERPEAKKNPDDFDEYVEFKHGFEQDNLWAENGNLFEYELEEGYIVIVRVESALN